MHQLTRTKSVPSRLSEDVAGEEGRINVLAQPKSLPSGRTEDVAGRPAKLSEKRVAIQKKIMYLPFAISPFKASSDLVDTYGSRSYRCAWTRLVLVK